MSFDHPGLAAFAALALLPPLLHLLDRRKARVHAFAALEFLLRAQRGGERRFRLRRLLLLLSRMALLAAVPLALARPHLDTPRARATVTSGPQATAFVFDGSGSMRYRRGGQSLFARAQQEGRRQLAQLAPDAPATALLCAAQAAAPLPPSDDRGALLSALDGFAVTQEPADLATCIERAGLALGQSEVAGKHIVVFTDLQQTGWDLRRPPPLIATSKGAVRAELEVVDVAHGELPNLALSDLSITAAPAVGSHGYQFAFTVHNFGREPVANLPVALEVRGQVVARGFCDLPGFGAEHKVLAATLPPGTVVEGRVFLPADSLTEDDAIPFVLPVPRQVRALIVDGAPSTLRYLDEAFFVQTALEGAGGAIALRTTDPEALTATELDGEGLDVVLLLNVHGLSKDVPAALRRFVERGGGLFVALGDRVDPESFSEALGDLLPAPLRLVKTAAPPPHVESSVAQGAVTAQSPAHFTRIDLSSPLFAGFGGGASAGLLDTRFYRYMLIEPPPKDVQVLASYEDGAPALLLSHRKEGRVLLFTSGVAREWNDWPIRASFVPVLQQAVLLLAHREEPRVPPVEIVGHAHVFPAGELVPVSARLPSGAEAPLSRAPGGERAIERLTEVGLTQVRLAEAAAHGGELGALDVAVAFDPRESNTRRLDPSEVTARYGGTVRADSAPGGGLTNGRFSLWTQLLVVSALCFVLEALLGA